MSWGTTPRLNGILIVRSERPGANSRRAPIVRPYLSRKRFCKISNPETRPLGPLGHLNRIVSTRPLWRSVCGPPSAAQRAVDPIKLTLRPNAGGGDGASEGTEEDFEVHGRVQGEGCEAERYIGSSDPGRGGYFGHTSVHVVEVAQGVPGGSVSSTQSPITSRQCMSQLLGLPRPSSRQ